MGHKHGKEKLTFKEKIIARRRWEYRETKRISGVDYVVLSKKGKKSKPLPAKIYHYVADSLDDKQQQEAFRWLTMAYDKIGSKVGVQFMFGLASNVLSFVPEGGDLDKAVANKEQYIEDTLVWYRKFLTQSPKGDKLSLHTAGEWLDYFKPLFYAYLEEGWVLDFLSHQRPDIYDRIKGNGQYFEFLCDLLGAVREEVGLKERYVIRPHEIFRLQKGDLSNKEIAKHGAIFGYNRAEREEAKKKAAKGY